MFQAQIEITLRVIGIAERFLPLRALVWIGACLFRVQLKCSRIEAYGFAIGKVRRGVRARQRTIFDGFLLVAGVVEMVRE